MKPEQKAAFIEDLRQQGKKVSMVGDGINDAPALAAAHVGMALRGGLDVAGEAASVILMGDRLGQVFHLFSCSEPPQIARSMSGTHSHPPVYYFHYSDDVAILSQL